MHPGLCRHRCCHCHLPMLRSVRRSMSPLGRTSLRPHWAAQLPSCFPFLIMPSCFPCCPLLQPCSTHPLRNPEAPSECRSRNHVYALPEFSCPSSVSPQVLNPNENSDLLEQLSREVATYQRLWCSVEWKPTGMKN